MHVCLRFGIFRYRFFFFLHSFWLIKLIKWMILVCMYFLRCFFFLFLDELKNLIQYSNIPSPKDLFKLTILKKSSRIRLAGEIGVCGCVSGVKIRKICLWTFKFYRHSTIIGRRSPMHLSIFIYVSLRLFIFDCSMHFVHLTNYIFTNFILYKKRNRSFVFVHCIVRELRLQTIFSYVRQRIYAFGLWFVLLIAS